MNEVVLHALAQKMFDRMVDAPREHLLELARRLRWQVDVGAHVTSARVPQRLRRNLGVDNLWRLRLADGWRALYTVRRKGTIQIIIVWIGTHKDTTA